MDRCVHCAEASQVHQTEFHKRYLQAHGYPWLTVRCELCVLCTRARVMHRSARMCICVAKSCVPSVVCCCLLHVCWGQRVRPVYAGIPT